MNLARYIAIATLSLLITFGAVATISAQESSPVASPVAEGTIEVLGLVESPGPLAVADLQTLPVQTADVTFQSGDGEQAHSYTGVLFWDALQHVGLALDPDQKNDTLHLVALLTANDGYQVVIGLGEIDPGFGNNPLLLAWEEDGAALSGEDGPLRLVVPGDVRGGRYLTGVASIEIIRVETAAG